MVVILIRSVLKRILPQSLDKHQMRICMPNQFNPLLFSKCSAEVVCSRRTGMHNEAFKLLLVVRPQRPKTSQPLTPQVSRFRSHSPAHPDGLPDLPPHQRNRVRAANQLYALVSRVIHLCEDLRIPWILENPANSYMWKNHHRCKPYLPFLQCVFTTVWRVTAEVDQAPLSWFGFITTDYLLCDDSHQHLPWRVQGPSGNFRSSHFLRAKAQRSLLLAS